MLNKFYVWIGEKKKKKGKEDISIVWFQGWEENVRELKKRFLLGP